MPEVSDRELVREIIINNRYLTLATTDGSRPWAATLEYMHDDRLNLYFLSLEGSLHAQQIECNPSIAAAVFDSDQPEYTPDATITLRGVQISGKAEKTARENCPDFVLRVIEELDPPMPPYAVFKIRPTAYYLPKLKDGVNQRIEVDMASR